MKLGTRDRQYLWHPFTQEHTADLPVGIVRGKGAYLYGEDGRSYLDLISSWWVNLHGHGHPKIAEAIYRQAKTLEQVIFSGFTHEPAVALCESLSTILPKSLCRFFFSDNGSTAVEVALKMAYQFWCNQGENNRHLFLSFWGAYHGDTFGAMSVGKSSGFHDPFRKLFFEVTHLPYPCTWMGDENVEHKEEESMQALEQYLRHHAHETVAFIVEPLIQGAGGMRICRPQFLKAVVDRLRQDCVLIIFDEVMTGFGRTGTHFSLEQVGVVPDLLCLSKGLSGGFLPLALTVASERVYRAFLGNTFEKAFAHGHSYTANPLGCAAALASLELLLEPETQKKIKEIEAVHTQWLPQLCKDVSVLVSPRILGTIAAWNVADSLTHYAHPFLQRGFPIASLLKKQFLKEGLLIRPLGNTIYLLPPYCIDASELDRTYLILKKVLQSNMFKHSG